MPRVNTCFLLAFGTPQSIVRVFSYILVALLNILLSNTFKVMSFPH